MVFVPLETAMRRLLNIPYIQTIYVQARSSAWMDRVEREVREQLRERQRLTEGRPDAFTIQNQQTLIRTERDAARAMTLLIGSVAGIALLVGGVGIMAVMLIAVRERSREIGLRRALGARLRDIRVQFLVEAALLAGSGSVLGITIGIAVTSAAARLGGMERRALMAGGRHGAWLLGDRGRGLRCLPGPTRVPTRADSGLESRLILARRHGVLRQKQIRLRRADRERVLRHDGIRHWLGDGGPPVRAGDVRNSIADMAGGGSACACESGDVACQRGDGCTHARHRASRGASFVSMVKLCQLPPSAWCATPVVAAEYSIGPVRGTSGAGRARSGGAGQGRRRPS